MIIKLVRHGQSESNIGKVDVTKSADNMVGLTSEGIHQARKAGEIIGKDFLENALLFRSPYRRTRETSIALTDGAGINPKDLTWIEDPLLREIELGTKNTEAQKENRKEFGWFYYRFKDGESPADVFTRQKIFINALMRKPKKNVVIVGHGCSLRVFLMAFMKLSVEEYTQMENIDNCEIITICKLEDLPEDLGAGEILFKTAKWVAYGKVRWYHKNVYNEDPFIEKMNKLKALSS